MAEKKKDDEGAKPKLSKKFIIIGAAAAVLIAGGTGAGVFLFTKSSGSSASAATETATLTPGTVTSLDAISVNLADGHYLKIGVALQGVASSGGGEESSDDLDGSKAYDAIINLYSNLSMTDLANAEQRNKYKDELQKTIIEDYTTETDGEKEESVMGIYLTQFVMQ